MKRATDFFWKLYYMIFFARAVMALATVLFGVFVPATLVPYDMIKQDLIVFVVTTVVTLCMYGYFSKQRILNIYFWAFSAVAFGLFQTVAAIEHGLRPAGYQTFETVLLFPALYIFCKYAFDSPDIWGKRARRKATRLFYPPHMATAIRKKKISWKEYAAYASFFFTYIAFGLFISLFLQYAADTLMLYSMGVIDTATVLLPILVAYIAYKRNQIGGRFWFRFVSISIPVISASFLVLFPVYTVYTAIFFTTTEEGVKAITWFDVFISSAYLMLVNIFTYIGMRSTAYPATAKKRATNHTSPQHYPATFTS